MAVSGKRESRFVSERGIISVSYTFDYFWKLNNFLSSINKNSSTKRNQQEDRKYTDVAMNKSRLGADMNHARDGGTGGS